MSFLRGLLWLLGAVAFITVAMYMTGNFEIADRLSAFFLTVQPWLPLTFSFDQFLVLMVVLSVLLAAIVLGGCAALVVYLAGRLSVATQKMLGQATATKKEVGLIREQHRRQYEQLLNLSQTLTKRLDKRVLAQGIVEAASRATSVSQANGVASLWLVNFETDTLQFELGLYCDASMFSRTGFQPTESPFAQVIASQKPWVHASWKAGLSCVNLEKAETLSAAGGVIVVPLQVESSILGVMIIFCHPDVLKSYEEQKPYYDALWGELALALAIAIQGEVAILDRLTGVHNREYFMKRLVQELERANRFQLPLSLLMIDIDNFKAVNDMLGHPQGDAVLRIIAKLVKKEVRAIDLAGRYGGEEFIIMLPETGYGDDRSSAAGALVVAERIRKAVEDEFQGLQKPLNLSVSIGVAVRRFPEDREADYRELIRLADEQLYRAKTTGKNKVCVFIPEKPQTVSG